MANFITDYDSLQARIKKYLRRGDLDDMIPLFIQLAEAEFNRRFRHRNMLSRQTQNTTGGERVYPLPEDYLKARALILNTLPRRLLTYKTPQQEVFLNQYSVSEQPQYFTTEGYDMILSPTPDGIYELEFLYYQRIPDLGSTDADGDLVTTNWLLDTNPDVYLFGALLQAQPYLLDDDRLDTWAKLYGNAAQGLIDTEAEEEWSSSPLNSNTATVTP